MSDIEVTDEMIAAARDASIVLTGHCPTYLETKAMLGAVLEIVERDYVSRWGVVRLEVPAEYRNTNIDEWKKWAADQAKCMGGTIVNIDDYETYTDDPQLSMRDCVVLKWKMRRD